MVAMNICHKIMYILGCASSILVEDIMKTGDSHMRTLSHYQRQIHPRRLHHIPLANPAHLRHSRKIYGP